MKGPRSTNLHKRHKTCQETFNMLLEILIMMYICIFAISRSLCGTQMSLPDLFDVKVSLLN